LCGHDCEAAYADLDMELQLAIDRGCENDCLDAENCPGKPGLHAGVVKAVYEIFGRRAKLWVREKATTIWSYPVPAAGPSPAATAEQLLCVVLLSAQDVCVFARRRPTFAASRAGVYVRAARFALALLPHDRRRLLFHQAQLRLGYPQHS